MIRKAVWKDLHAVAALYNDALTAGEKGEIVTGWVRDVYPTEATARKALERDDLFVMEEGKSIVGTGIINQAQEACYALGAWQWPASEAEVMVLHTLVIGRSFAGRGCGRRFVDFFEDYARARGCLVARLDTNARNTVARKIYKNFGYSEAGIVPVTFNGIPDVHLVLLEKLL